LTTTEHRAGIFDVSSPKISFLCGYD